MTINVKKIKANKKKSILSNCISHGIDISYNCGAGLCGKYKFTLISGEVKKSHENKHGFLACSAYPIGNIEISVY
ncbi:2Fe-2S iron-sulfur cluster-binding protein [Vibrio profundum]|uniref:2Fe-2S iron-sulfur cluster-binding protein n=1 Tax=Vibrio profundum TaxID=2910247 RepID=UPI003D0E8123